MTTEERGLSWAQALLQGWRRKGREREEEEEEREGEEKEDRWERWLAKRGAVVT